MAKIAFLRSTAPEVENPEASLPAEASDELAVYKDTRGAGRIGLWALAIGFGGFILWASFAPLDEGVVAPGLVSIETHRKPIQHLSGGLVKEVLVHEGQVVKEDQVLMRLDSATAKANFEGSRQKYMTLRAMEARLVAEQARSSHMVFHPELAEAGRQDPM